MGISKTNLFTEDQNQLANLAKVLGHPARIAIIQQLIKVNSCINSTLVHELGLAQATISQHLQELKKAEIIQGSIEGNTMCYCINPDKWAFIQETFNTFFNQYTNSCSTDCC